MKKYSVTISYSNPRAGGAWSKFLCEYDTMYVALEVAEDYAKLGCDFLFSETNDTLENCIIIVYNQFSEKEVTAIPVTFRH